MGGTLRGKIDCYINTGSRHTNAQNVFKCIYDFLNSHPNMTQIARYGGVSSTAASVNFHDETNPFLTNCWCVFRMNDATLESGAASGYAGSRTFPWYIYVQWTRFDQSAWNGTGASPGVVDNSTNYGGSYSTLGMQFAIPVGTTPGTSEVAWNGGGTLGTNTKASPVWKTTAGAPAGFQGSYVFPRANGPGGSYATNREASAGFYPISFESPTRLHILADDDSILFLNSQSDDNNYQAQYFGLYTPRPGLTIDYPMVHLMEYNLPLAMNTLYGTTNGTNRNGGVAWNTVATNNVRGVIFGRPDEFHNIYTHPNNMFSDERYDEYNIPVIGSETPSYYGLAGHIDFIREVYDVGTNDGTSDRSRVFFGTNASQATKLSVPWKSDATNPVGAAVPRSNFTRQGINFP